jgi:acyl carrier protein
MPQFMDNNPTSTSSTLTPPITTAQLRALIAGMDAVIDLDKLSDDTPFADAGADSLDFFNIVSEIQLATGVNIPDDDVEQVSTLNNLVAYINANAKTH